MASRGGIYGPPYEAALWLASWAVSNLGYFLGKLDLAGIPISRPANREELDEVSLSRLIDFAHVFAVEGFDPIERERYNANLVTFGKGLLPPQDLRETWGTSDEAIASQQSLMETVGG